MGGHSTWRVTRIQGEAAGFVVKLGLEGFGAKLWGLGHFGGGEAGLGAPAGVCWVPERAPGWCRS